MATMKRRRPFAGWIFRVGQAGKGLGRLRQTGTSFSYTFNNDTFGKLFGKKDNNDDSNNPPTDPNASNDPEFEQISSGEEGDQQGKMEGGRLRGAKKDTGEFDSYGYMVNKVPWSLSFSYSMQLRYGDFDPSKLEYKYKLTHALSFNGNIQPTKNWRFNFNATYDFDTHKDILYDLQYHSRPALLADDCQFCAGGTL